jgi:hypothetical protein
MYERPSTAETLKTVRQKHDESPGLRVTFLQCQECYPVQSGHRDHQCLLRWGQRHQDRGGDRHKEA